MNLLIFFACVNCLLITSCVDRLYYREVKILDVEKTPLEGVQVFPQQMFGPGSKLSDNQGNVLIPKGEEFSLRKDGYECLFVGSGDKSSTYMLKFETRASSVILEKERQRFERLLNEQLRP
jgi:hypothetical protein